MVWHGEHSQGENKWGKLHDPSRQWCAGEYYHPEVRKGILQFTLKLHMSYVFYVLWYFLIYSYYLTVSNGHSLTALKSVKFTQCSGSFKWGGVNLTIYPKSAHELNLENEL